MKTRIFASIIIAALASSAAHAGTELPVEETYSAALPSINRADYGLGSYYVETSIQPVCRQVDLDPLSVVYPEAHGSVSNDLIPQAGHVVCLRKSSRG